MGIGDSSFFQRGSVPAGNTAVFADLSAEVSIFLTASHTLQIDPYFATVIEGTYSGTSVNYIHIKPIALRQANIQLHDGNGNYETFVVQLGGIMNYPTNTRYANVITETTYLNGFPSPPLLQGDPVPSVISIIPEPGNLGYEGDLYRVTGTDLDITVNVDFLGLNSNSDVVQSTTEIPIHNISIDKTEAFIIVPSWSRTNDSLSLFNDVVSVCPRYDGVSYCHSFEISYSPSPSTGISSWYDDGFQIETELDIPVDGFNVFYDSVDSSSQLEFHLTPDSLTKDGNIISFAGNLWDFLVNAKDSAGQALDAILHPLDFADKVTEAVTGGWTKTITKANDGVEIIKDSLVDSNNDILLDELAGNNLSGSEIQVFHPATLLEAAADIDNANVDDCCKLTNKTRLLALQKEMQMRWVEHQSFKRAFLTNENVSVITSAALWNSMTYGKTLAFDEEVIRVYKENNGVLLVGKLIDLV